MFVFEMFIITDETTFISCEPLKAVLTVLSIKLLWIMKLKLKTIVDNYGMHH